MEQLIKLSAVIAGTMKWGRWGAKFSAQEYLSMIEKCLELGVTSFDHADIYGHYTVEEEFGKALSLNSSIRTKIQIITKCGIKLVTAIKPEHTIKYYDTGKHHIINSVNTSLKNFNTDYIDMLLIHRPDPLMNPYEIADVFYTLKKQGKILHFGVSNFNALQTDLIHSAFPVTVNQVEISILNLSPFTDGTLDYCLKQKLIPMAWSPLGGGKFFDEEDERNKRIIAIANLLAEKYSGTIDQILLAWLLKHPSGIRPVLGTAKAERIEKAVLSTKIKLITEEWFMLWRASTGKEVD